MGATIDIKTARPVDNPDMVMSVCAKMVSDSSVENGDSAPAGIPDNITDVCVYRNMRYQFSTAEVIQVRKTEDVLKS